MFPKIEKANDKNNIIEKTKEITWKELCQIDNIMMKSEGKSSLSAVSAIISMEVIPSL